MTRAELFAGSSATELATTLLAPSRELSVDRAVAERARRIRRELALRMRDALIAATAVEHRVALTTRNVRDFRSVRGLRLRSSR